ncbi:hypothetical protein K4F52_010236 [Lecanicillium sp. MT-2017a]|nr:hypothetical protein K4F52_010236 [Lecanicillium sp. MT-2017a]
MARQIPDATLFLLKPKGNKAKEVFNTDRNQHLLLDGALRVGQVSSKTQAPDGTRCIASIGRDGDVVIPAEFLSISRVHCWFLFDPERQTVAFQFDPCSSRVYGRSGTQLRKNMYRVDETYIRVVRVGEGDDDIGSIELGKKGEKTIQLIVQWNYCVEETALRLREWSESALPKRPSLAETQLSYAGADEEATYTFRNVPTGSDAPNCGKIRVQRRGLLGSGAFGDVFEGVNLDTGELLAVKALRRPEKKQDWAILRREIRIHATLRHPNIVQYIGGCGWELQSGRLEIYLALKQGTLEGLVKGKSHLADSLLAVEVYRDMLKALDYIHCEGLIHRDLKPENILFTLKNGKYCFLIADLGLSNEQHLARSYCGTRDFMAPEIHSGRKQTSAIDMWSLFVTLLWVANVDDFRSNKFGTYLALLFWIAGAASRNWEGSKSVQGLMVLDYTRRASAAQILVNFFGGEGLTTPIENVRDWEPPRRPPSEDDVMLFVLPHKSRVANRRRVAAHTQQRRVCARGRINKAATKQPGRRASKQPDRCDTKQPDRCDTKQVDHPATKQLEHRATKPLVRFPAQPKPEKKRLRPWAWPFFWNQRATKVAPKADLKSTERHQMPGAFPDEVNNFVVTRNAMV